MVDVGGKPLSRRRAVARATRADGARDRAAPARAAEGRRARHGPARRGHGGEADERPDPALPPAAALPRRRHSRGRRATRVEILASAETTAQTGVEMEALVAASIAALTVYDMAKAVDKAMVVAEVHAGREDEGRRCEGGRADRLRRRRRAATREDRSGDVLEELLARGRLRGRAPRRRPTRPTRSPPRSSSWPARPHSCSRPAAPGSRRATSRPRRRVRARARRPGDRRGDPRRLDREDAARAALSRHRRHRRLGAGRQPARLARRLPRRLRRAEARARARAELLAGERDVSHRQT